MKDLLKLEALEHIPLENIGDLFRIAHLSVFGREGARSWRIREIAAYHTNGQIPKYVLDYLKKFSIEE